MEHRSVQCVSQSETVRKQLFLHMKLNKNHRKIKTMDKLKGKSPRNQFPTIMVKSSNSIVDTVGSDVEIDERKLNFFYAFRPVYIFSRLMGLMPFSVVRSVNGNGLAARVKAYDAIWFVLSILWSIFLAAMESRNLRLPQNPNESLTINVGDHLLLIVGLSVGTLSIAMDLVNRNRLVKIIEKFEMFDDEVAKFGIEVNNKGCHRRGVLWLLVAFVLAQLTTLSAFNIYGSIRQNHSTISMIHFFFAYSFQSLVMATTLTAFIGLMMSLHRRFKALNAILRKHFMNDGTNCISTTLNKEVSISTIKFIGRQYSFLSDLMAEINCCYSFQAMVYCGTCFVLTVLTFYSFYRYLLQQNEFFEEASKVHMNRCVFFSSYIHVLIYQGDLTGKQGKKVSKLVHSIMNSCYDTEVVQTLDQLCSQISQQNPKATCGLFSFDWTLLFIMVGSSATYLTILVQFEP